MTDERQPFAPVNPSDNPENRIQKNKPNDPAINDEVRRILENGRKNMAEKVRTDPNQDIRTAEEIKNNEVEGSIQGPVEGTRVGNENESKSGAQTLGESRNAPSAMKLPGTREGLQKEESKATAEVMPTEGEKRIHHLHGQKVAITDEQKAEVDKKTEEVMNSLRGRQISDLPLTDEFWTKQRELDAYIANLKG